MARVGPAPLEGVDILCRSYRPGGLSGLREMSRFSRKNILSGPSEGPARAFGLTSSDEILPAGPRREDDPADPGCSGRTTHSRLRAGEESGIRDRLHADLLTPPKKAHKLDTVTVIIDGVAVRAFRGGEETGSSPVDRSRPGTKQTLMVDPSGVPLAIRTAGANAVDHRQLIPRGSELEGRRQARSFEGTAGAGRYPDGGDDGKDTRDALAGRGSSHTSPSVGRERGVGWVRSTGWRYERSIGPRNSHVYECVTTARA